MFRQHELLQPLPKEALVDEKIPFAQTSQILRAAENQYVFHIRISQVHLRKNRCSAKRLSPSASDKVRPSISSLYLLKTCI